MDIRDIKQRFSIIGNSPLLNRAVDIAQQVAATDLTVLITGESGSGKEVFSKIIHNLSARKHGTFIAVNCGAIPEGTIDSELFGHEKGSFTGAHDARKGYFEVVDGGTIFLDEIAEMPLGTQARLLRVLESGEYIRVGASKVQKTNARVIAATNVNLFEAVSSGKFREDLYYRLNTVPLKIPSLRERKEDIFLLFRKFIADFTDKYRAPSIELLPDAQEVLENYPWPGNVRQLKNIAEQISVLERDRVMDGPHFQSYLQEIHTTSKLPMVLGNQAFGSDMSERDILYKVLFDMKKDIIDLKKLVIEILQGGINPADFDGNHAQVINKLYKEIQPFDQNQGMTIQPNFNSHNSFHNQAPTFEVEESLSLEDREKDLITKALKKHKNRRKNAAAELGISERTLYRKIKEFDL